MDEYSPNFDHSPQNWHGRHQSSLSRRNSSVWLASAAMDNIDLRRNSSTSIPTFGTPLQVPQFSSGFFNNGALWAMQKQRLDLLPMEILTVILQYVVASDHGSADLCRLLSTCGRIYDIGVAILYRHIIFRYPHTFDKFRWSIEGTGYGQHVRVFDFSAFTSVGLGRTKLMNQEIQMVTSTTILRALDLCPQLTEFLAAESIDTDLSSLVIDKLLSMPQMNALDFCASTDPSFIRGLENSLVMAPNFGLYTLTRLSLHCCNTIPSHILTALLSKCHNLTRLDLTHTLVTDEGLLALPDTVQLTHLSLSRCVKLSSSAMVRFLLVHPATKRLKWLNLMFESTKPNPMTRRDFDTIIRSLPPHIKYLNIYGQPVTDEHLDIIDTSNLYSLWIAYSEVTLPALERFLSRCDHLKYINLSGLACVNAWTAQNVEFLNIAPGIQMFEFSNDMLSRLKGVKIPGFFLYHGRGRRGWLLRSRLPPLEREQSRTDLRQVTFSFGGLAQERIAKKNVVQVAAPRLDTPPPPWDPLWRFASQKMNVSAIGVGGASSPAIYANEGIYNYYSYHNN